MRRPAAFALIAALAVALAGCATTPARPAAAGPGYGWKYYGVQGGSDTSTEPPATSGATVLGNVGFDDGLADGITVDWSDPFFSDPDYTVATADDGNGHWSYNQVSTGCVLSFWQTRADGIEPVGDEKARSETTLASFLGWNTSQLDGYTFDVSLGWTGGNGATFDALAVTGTDEDGSDWITLARAFDGPDEALALDITCPAGTDSETQLADLTPDYVAARAT